jgi:dTDP-4-amino-4,6-dideoxygalactose transaminase
MPVHVYGTPCDTERIDTIAKAHGLKVIYDAAHAFKTTSKGSSVLLAGDISTLSFHATKTYNTVEGGALICHSAEMKQQIDYLKNFGFEDETVVVGPGINSKMDEIRAAYGLLNLKHVDSAIAARKRVAEQYVEALKDVEGITLYQPIVDSFASNLSGVPENARGVLGCSSPLTYHLNYSYFPIFVDADAYGLTRDELYEKMRANNVLGRRYFYPLISTFSPYNMYPSATKENLRNAHRMADSVICLPMHHALSEEDVKRVIDCIRVKELTS